MKRMLFLVMFALCIPILQGCNDRGRSSSVKIVENQIRKCHELMSNGDLYCNHKEFLDFRRSLLQSIMNVSNKTARTELANRYIVMMKGVDLDLSDTGYEDYEMRVLRFEKLSGTIYNILKGVDVDKGVLMEYFLGCMEKYRMACLSIPATAKEKNESEQAFFRRKATVNNLHAMYLSRLCTFERVEVKEHLAFFPPELHDEYKRRSATIMNFPSREDLLRTPMFGGDGVML